MIYRKNNLNLFRVPALLVVWISIFAVPGQLAGQVSGDDRPSDKTTPSESTTLNVLFIGNSYTARHHLSDVVKQLAEAGNPNLTFNPTTVIYGGRRLVDHWELGTQNVVNSHRLTRQQIEETIERLESAITKDPENRHFKNALKRHRQMLTGFESMSRVKWDIVVLQSYRDDEGDDSVYAQYAPKFAKLAKSQGARVILYETTPKTQNAKALESPPDRKPVLEKTKSIAKLANKIECKAAPMALVGSRCQQERPDLPLRFINDAHLNKTMAYLTACTIYAAIFDKSPEGLSPNSVTDIRFLETAKGKFDRTKDRDGKPITLKLPDKDRLQLQRIAWEGYQEFERMRKTTAKPAK